MHKGLKEREDARDEILDLDSIDVTEKEIYTLTSDALDVIGKKTKQLQQSVDDQTNQTSNDRRPAQSNYQWKKEFGRQNNAILNNDDEDECVTNPLPTPSISLQTSIGVNVEVLIQVIGCNLYIKSVNVYQLPNLILTILNRLLDQI